MEGSLSLPPARYGHPCFVSRGRDGALATLNIVEQWGNKGKNLPPAHLKRRAKASSCRQTRSHGHSGNAPLAASHGLYRSSLPFAGADLFSARRPSAILPRRLHPEQGVAG